MKKLLIIFIFYLFASSGFAQQQDSVKTVLYNRSYKNVYVALAYYKRMPEGDIALCSYGWFEVKSYNSKTIWLPALREKGMFYHAHNRNDRNDNWGGSLFFMVHPTLPFHLSYANNSALSTSMDKDLNEEELKSLEAYPFREIKWNPKGYFQVNLLD
ncbi:MAG: DUF1036 domain-containing protein [Thermonemataceae bacterium]|nr:DUF1036 domain-containing protein [Thermonemataceae bacterium]